MNDTLSLRGRPFLSCAIAIASVAAPLRADGVQYNVSVPVTPVPWNQTVTLPAFDPSLGILRVVQITVSGAVHGTWGLENTTAQPAWITACLAARVTVGTPGGGFFPTLNPAFEIYSHNLGAYDGTTDYAGSSGDTLVFGPEGGTGVPNYTLDIYQTPALTLYVATAPGQTIAITLDSAEIAGCGPLPPGVVDQYTLDSSATVEVRYTYDPMPTWFCRSNPWTGCPCGNLGSRGCGNSVNGSGGALDSSGQASVSNDTLVLAGSGMTNGTALYIQGTGHDYGGIVYGDGIRCAVGQIRRLGAKANSGGASQYPQPGDASVSVRGMIPGPGATRYYQTIYRDPPNFCTSATVNITDGVAIRWGP